MSDFFLKMACHHPIMSHCFTKYVLHSGVVHKSGPIQTCLEEELSYCFTYTPSILHTDFKQYQRNPDCLSHHISSYFHSQAGWFIIYSVYSGRAFLLVNKFPKKLKCQNLRFSEQLQGYKTCQPWLMEAGPGHEPPATAQECEGSSHRKILCQAAEERD